MQFYKIADACIITLDGSNHIGDTLPGKVQTYMAAGKPIIGAMNGAGSQMIGESQCGYCCSAGDYKGLADSCVEYIEKQSANALFGKNAREYFFNNFTEEIHFMTLENRLWDLIQ